MEGEGCLGKLVGWAVTGLLIWITIKWAIHGITKKVNSVVDSIENSFSNFSTSFSNFFASINNEVFIIVIIILLTISPILYNLYRRRKEKKERFDFEDEDEKKNQKENSYYQKHQNQDYYRRQEEPKKEEKNYSYTFNSIFDVSTPELIKLINGSYNFCEIYKNYKEKGLATEEEMKKIWKKLVPKVHPDKAPALKINARVLNDTTKKLNELYQNRYKL